MSELQLAGNFSKKGRALLSFDKLFESNLKYQLVKELLTSIFTVP
jgi:ribosome biogenesis protein BRX1